MTNARHRAHLQAALEYLEAALATGASIRSCSVTSLLTRLTFSYLLSHFFFLFRNLNGSSSSQKTLSSQQKSFGMLRTLLER